MAMTLGDVLPALQQGTIDGALSAIPVCTNMHYIDTAKYVTETNQNIIFVMIEVSKRWYESLPADLQQVIDKAGAEETLAINPFAAEDLANARKVWVTSGG